ncbi:reductive dehalogenase [Candidatus Poriferisocius sp.]|uniref:reductive dehalogenase n=1 Tax=Candidatus Poriferisocius sp. TaxID=3101276 RepID=UPI003B01BDBD
MRLFSYKNRPVSMGPLPLETLKRAEGVDVSQVQTRSQLTFDRNDRPESLVNAMRLYAKYMDAARNGPTSEQRVDIPSHPNERADQLKSMCYFMDALAVGCGVLSEALFLSSPYINADLESLHVELGQLPEDRPGFHHHIAHGLQHGIDENGESIADHGYYAVIVYGHSRELRDSETAFEWLFGAGWHCASIRASETAVVLANYIRTFGFNARAHTESTTDLDLAKAGVAAGVLEVGTDGVARHPYLGLDFGLAAVSTDLEIEVDQPLAPRGIRGKVASHGPSWWFGGGPALGRGKGTIKNAFNLDPYRKQSFEIDAYGMHKIKRRDTPSTFIDEVRVPRVPKRHDGFWRGNYGDFGEAVQINCADEFCVIKSAVGEAQYGLIGAFHLIERLPEAPAKTSGYEDPQENAKKVKSALHFLGADMVGISRAPDWAWYSHDLDGSEIEPYHKNAITILIDQGHETMEGASGDDWISSSQSMRTYLRGMLLGGVVAEHIRNLGYGAFTHSVVNGDVLQTPLVLLSGLGEMSRIGDIALNPFLGPRLKTMVVTTDMPLEADKPIDFGLQSFCNSCNKCARECPSGAISAGPKVMFNGYETWKADVEKCTRYRVTHDSGAMCGRCMKTCPWNLEGIFVESPFRWLAMKTPRAAKWLAKLDDKIGNGKINPTKKWWWDIETTAEGEKRVVSEDRINRRELTLDFDLRYEDQTLACYPADMAPAPVPVQFTASREEGIRRYKSLLSVDEYKARLAAGDTEDLVPQFNIPADTPEVQYLRISTRDDMAEDVVMFELEKPDKTDVTPFTAGAHIDLVIDAPFTRQYSLAGDPADQSKYVLGILNEPEGRGGSLRAYQRLHPGEIVAVTGPRNHFALDEEASKSLLLGGGIGVTPLISMAHRLHALGREFELHYSFRSRETAGFIDHLQRQPWSQQVYIHCSEEGTRADLSEIVGTAQPGHVLYACGPEAFMDAVFAAGTAGRWAEKDMRREYFTAPEQAEYENTPFTVLLERSQQSLDVPVDKSIAEVLQDEGLPVITKCSDGLCAACVLSYTGGDVEHRDFVLSSKERETRIATCSSRAREEGGIVALDL